MEESPGPSGAICTDHTFVVSHAICWALQGTKHISKDLLISWKWDTERRKSISQILSLLVTSHGCEQFPKFHSTIQIRAKRRPFMILPLISMLWMLALEAESLACHPSTPSKGLSPGKCWTDIWKVWFPSNLIIFVQKTAWVLLFQLPLGLL